MTPLSYDRLEDTLVERLAPLRVRGIDVQAQPDTEVAAKRAAGVKTRVTVSFGSANYGDGADNTKPPQMLAGATAQRELCDVIVAFEAQRLRGTSGIYEAVRLAQILLLGYRVPGWNKLTFRRFQYVSADNGLFTFHLTVHTDRFVMEATDPHGTPIGLDGIDPTLPLLTDPQFTNICE